MRETTGEIVAFGDANVIWAPDSVRQLVRPFADPRVGMACGYVRLVNPAGGTNQEGVYWRYEMWLRARESADSFDHGLKRRDLCRSPRRLPRGRSAIRPRHELPVPDGAKWLSSGLRAECQGGREHDHRHRGRVPPQGADVRACLADAVQGQDVRAATARPDLLGRARSRTGCCATGAGRCTSCCWSQARFWHAMRRSMRWCSQSSSSVCCWSESRCSPAGESGSCEFCTTTCSSRWRR